MSEDEDKRGEDKDNTLKSSEAEQANISSFPTTEMPAIFKKKLKKSGIFYRFFFENTSLKFFALVVALIMFALVKKDIDKEVQIEIPVILTEINEDYIFIGEVPKTLDVRLKGRWSKLIKVMEHKPNPYFVSAYGLKDSSKYNFSSEIIESLIGVQGVQIMSYSPSSFTLKMEAKIIKKVSVNMVITGQLANGYKVDHSSIVITPNEVTLWGAKSAVKEIQEINTEPIDITGMDTEFHAEVYLKKSSRPFVFFENEKVKVKIPIVAPVKDVVFRGVSIEIKNCRYGMECQVIPNKYNIKLIGPEPLINKINKEDLGSYLYIDAEGISDKEGKYPKIPPIIEEIENIQIKIWPRIFSINVQQISGPAKVNK